MEKKKFLYILKIFIFLIIYKKGLERTAYVFKEMKKWQVKN